MLKWCSYCQKFMGEIPPYEDFHVTHGMCNTCARVEDFTDSDIAHAGNLRKIRERLFDAGERSDLDAAAHTIENGIKVGLKSVDILIGVMAPMLSEVGDDWTKNILCVAEEHRFTNFCEKVFDLISTKVKAELAVSATPTNPSGVLLMNARGNSHVLGLRMLALRLLNSGRIVEIVDMPDSSEELAMLVARTQPELILVSMALAEQCKSVITFAERIAELPTSIRPRVIVGGYAVKAGLVSAIPGAELQGDISSVLAI